MLTGPDSVMVRAFASEAGVAGSNPGRVIPKTLKIISGTSGYLAWRSAFIRQALASLLFQKRCRRCPVIPFHTDSATMLGNTVAVCYNGYFLVGDIRQTRNLTPQAIRI